jgi:pSer/pThr/pTyr-binding forkhead associated (FHA) protein
VGFILTTKSGNIEGEEFVFGDGGEARIGRTHGNDVVVYDNEASRSHARVFETDEGCFIEDLGSANGTFLNGEELLGQEPSLLHTGDIIGVGSGELVFCDQAADSTGEVALPEESTVIKPVEEMEAERRPPSALAVASRAPRQVVRQASPSKPAQLAPAAKTPMAKRKDQATVAPESAAERARKQREAQKRFFGRLHYAFLALDSKKRRIAVAGLASAVLVVLSGIFFLLYAGGPKIGQTHEPRRLTVGGWPLKDSFGWGKEVTWPNVDAKQFEFHVVAPGRVVAVIRYYAKDISSEEVDILFNNVSLGFIPADTLDAQESELVVPPQLIRNDETNTLLFDNVRNPPGKETWRIWGIAVDIEPVPNFASMEEARAAIASAMQAAQQSYEARNIAPANLYESWRAYRKAWLFAESLETKNTSEYEFILNKYREVRRELDDLCSKYILEFRRIYSTNPSYERIVGVLEEILRHFPKPDHYCHQEAKEALGGS